MMIINLQSANYTNEKVTNIHIYTNIIKNLIKLKLLQLGRREDAIKWSRL